MPIAPFDYEPRTRVVFGSGTLERLGELVREHGGTNVLLVTDRGLQDAGHAERVKTILREAGIRFETFDNVRPNPTTRDIEAGTEFARPRKIDMLVGLGGGSSMDCAKGINFLLTNGGRMQDYRGTGKATRPMLPLIAIPTTSGTGSEAQSYAVISDEQTHMKMACGDKKAAAVAAILDPVLTVTMPRAVTAATGIDALSHALESFVTTRRNPVSQLFSRQAWQLLLPSLQRVLEVPEDQDARGAMLLGAHLAGAAIENSMLGATHALANPLSAYYELIHGVAIGILLPHVMRYNSQNPDVASLYATLAKDVGLSGDDDQALTEQLIQTLQRLLQLAEQPLSLAECGVAADQLPQMATDASQQWTAQFNPRAVTTEDLQEIYRCALASPVAAF